MIDHQETTGFQILYRMWPKGYDPMSKGERPYGPNAPASRSAARATAEGPHAPQGRQRLALSLGRPP